MKTVKVILMWVYMLLWVIPSIPFLIMLHIGQWFEVFINNHMESMWNRIDK